MKAVKMVLLVCLMSIAVSVEASYPANFSFSLPNGVTANVEVVSEGGMQVAQIVFSSESGELGEVVLSPTQLSKSNIVYGQPGMQGQVVTINLLTLQPATMFETGSVTCEGTATDMNGMNPEPFSVVLGNWVN